MGSKRRTWKRWFLVALGAALALAPTLTVFAGYGESGSYP